MRATFNDPQIQADFERDGFVVIPFLNADEVADLRNVYFNELGVAPGDPGRACISTFHTYDDDYKQAVDDNVRRVFTPHLDEVFDDQRYLPANYLTKWPGGMSGFGIHQDLTLVDETKARSCEVWCALEDIDEANGQLWCAPGSHDWVPTMRGIHSFPTAFQDVEKRVIDRHAIPVPLKAGEAIVFNHAVMHFSYPNRTETPRLVAIMDLIPSDAQHIHVFGDGEGNVDAYEIDESFWVENNPFTLQEPPPVAQKIGPVDFEPTFLTDELLDELVAEGRAVDHEPERHGALNPGRAWCHRCGTTEGMEGTPGRWSGNVTLLCDDCKAREAELASV
jgi:hypothetical protein